VSAAVFRSMGCRIVVAGAPPATRSAIRRCFEDADRRFSRFRPDSELRWVNARSGRPTLLSEPFAAMLRTALEMAAATDGLVDPTIGAAIEAAGYDRDFADLGDDHRPAGAAAPAGHWREIALSGRTLTMPGGCVLDLNGVVKAATADEAALLLPGPGFISAGGDVATRGGVDLALPAGGPVRLVKGGMATSGCSLRRWRRGGVWQHHLIDPATGAPARSPWVDVTACGVTCLVADVAAKAAFLLGPAGPEWLDERGIPGRFVARSGRVTLTSGWSALAPEPACT
jgi:FAD:protein FMN transferase